jgi:hypothetical protein
VVEILTPVVVPVVVPAVVSAVVSAVAFSPMTIRKPVSLDRENRRPVWHVQIVRQVEIVGS